MSCCSMKLQVRLDLTPRIPSPCFPFPIRVLMVVPCARLINDNYSSMYYWPNAFHMIKYADMST